MRTTRGGRPEKNPLARFLRVSRARRIESHLGMLVDGHTYKTAAADLGVTVHAVSFHMRHVYEKLRVHSKSEAVATALRHRLLH